MIIKRKIYNNLLLWKRNNGKTALLIEGARRTGKSYISTLFAKKEYKSFIVIDFSLENPSIIDLFNSGLNDLDEFFIKLQFIYNTKLYDRNSIIIFDEVQLFPKARQAIKHFVADGRFDFIETGSLISLKQNVQDILIPSEEESITLYPLDFEEFLWAIGDEISIPFLKNKFDNFIALDEVTHKTMLKKFRTYMLVGGMPQAVIEYVKTNDLELVDNVKKNILTLYRNDVGKFAGKNLSKVLNIFDKIPANLSRHDKKFSLASLKKGAKFRDYEASFIWLKEAMITNCCFRVSDPSIGMGLTIESSYMKNYMMDTGLLITLAFFNNKFLDNKLYKALLDDKLNINEGMIIENAIAQVFRTKGHDLFFYSTVNKSKHRMEVDFILRKNNKIIPVEVKSSNYTKHKPLDYLREKNKKKIGNSYIIYTKNLKKIGDIYCIPLYMSIFL
ncbi:MAG: ATP-binding protein [Pleomorphochaeta sp.]